MLLDEPTSSMDSWAEADWFKRLKAQSENRTVVLVTHRLTTAMRADLIYVMKGGEVVESGNHDALLALDGLYAQSWRAQIEAGSEPSRPQPALARTDSWQPIAIRSR